MTHRHHHPAGGRRRPRPCPAGAGRPPARHPILALDLAHAEAIFKGDRAALERLPTDDHTVDHPANRIVREEATLLALIDEGVIRCTRFERRPQQLLFHPDLVVVNGRRDPAPGRGAPNAGEVLRSRYTPAPGGSMRDSPWRSATPTTCPGGTRNLRRGTEPAGRGRRNQRGGADSSRASRKPSPSASCLPKRSASRARCPLRLSAGPLPPGCSAGDSTPSPSRSMPSKA